MGFDWFQFDHDLPEKAEVIGIYERTDADIDQILGRLCLLWRLADGQTVDGVLHNTGPKSLSRICGGTPDFWLAVESVGWIKFEDGSAIVPDFEKRFGRSKKRRIADAERKLEARTKAAKQAKSGRRADAHRQPSGQAADTERTQSGRTEDAQRTQEQEPQQEQQQSSDHIRTSWKDKEFQSQVKGIARESFRGSPFLDDTSAYREDDRKDLLGIAAIHHSGQIRPQWFLSSLDAIHNRTDQKPVTAPVRLFKRILADRWPKEAEKRFGGFYKALFAVIADIPSDMLKQRQPAGQEAGASP